MVFELFSGEKLLEFELESGNDSSVTSFFFGFKDGGETEDRIVGKGFDLLLPSFSRKKTKGRPVEKIRWLTFFLDCGKR